VTVQDTSAPVIARIAATPDVLRSPNHKMVAVTIAVTATDQSDAAPVARITKVTSNEPENDTGDGDTAPDWTITGPLTLNLCAERSGRGNGRSYKIIIEVADRFGNVAYGFATVSVPK
jgi:hypothetical protein